MVSRPGGGLRFQDGGTEETFGNEPRLRRLLCADSRSLLACPSEQAVSLCCCGLPRLHQSLVKNCQMSSGRKQKPARQSRPAAWPHCSAVGLSPWPDVWSAVPGFISPAFLHRLDQQQHWLVKMGTTECFPSTSGAAFFSSCLPLSLV